MSPSHFSSGNLLIQSFAWSKLSPVKMVPSPNMTLKVGSLLSVVVTRFTAPTPSTHTPFLTSGDADGEMIVPKLDVLCGLLTFYSMGTKLGMCATPRQGCGNGFFVNNNF